MLSPNLPKTEVEIDGIKFTIPTLDAKAGRKLVVKLMAALAPALEGAADKDKEALGLALLGGALKSLSPELLDEFCDAFGKQSNVEVEPGKWPLVSEVFGTVFAGRYALMFLWLFECCKVNFADFLSSGSLMSALGSAGTRLRSQSPST